MPPAPLIVSSTLAVAAVAGAMNLAFGDGPFAPDAAALVAGGMLVLSLVAVAGVLLSRGRWARPFAAGVAGAWIGVAASQDLRWLTAVVMASAAIALSGAVGPWLSRWVRHRPSAEGPPPAAVVVLVALITVPAALGATVPDSVPWPAWVLASWSLALALALSRATPGSLLGVRVLHAPACLTVGLAIGPAATAAVGSLGVVAAVFAWRREVAVAVTPIPTRGSEVLRIPPELAPQAVLDAARPDPGSPER